MNLLKVLGIKSRGKKKREVFTDGVDFAYCDPMIICASNIPDMPLRERAIAAFESGASWEWGGGKWNPFNYDSGYFNAVKKCSAIFGIKPSDCNFKKIGAGWYHVEIEGLVLMTHDYHEYFGMFYWLRSPCPHCGNMVRGNKMISSLYDLGEAIKESGPHREHFRYCLPWRTKCAERLGDSSLVPTMDYKDWEYVCAR